MNIQAPMPQQPPTVLMMAASGKNLASMIEPHELARIGNDAVRMYKLDKSSMGEWLEMMQKGIDLAKLVAKDKNYPFKGASNVKYPLITTAALQFNARAYPAIVPPDGGVVKGKPYGADPMGQKAARGDRIAAHMSWQLTGRMEEWEVETDRLLVQLPVVGKMIRKVWYDEEEQRPRCRLLVPGKFIVNDKVKTLSDAPRCTEEFTLYPYELATKRKLGLYRDVDYVDGEGEDEQEPQDFIEQHCRIDLDGDGYPEPYIVTVHVESERVARIVGDFTQQDVMMSPMGGVVKIKASTYFVDYEFMPSLDGGFWSTGFGLLLGPTSEAINSTINMMMDAGHMASRGGGFIGSDFRIKGGHQHHRPGEWKLVQAKGGMIRESMVPITFPGPDATLFQLLGLMIESGQDVAGVKDVLMGDTGGRAMTATTTMALIEQGMQQFSAVYKRIYRALRAEYRLIAKINAGTVGIEEYNAFHDQTDPNGQPMIIDPREDYGSQDMDIVPVADPRSITKMQEAAKAQLVMDLATQGLLDPGAAAARILEAGAISDVEELLPQPSPQDQMMQEMQMAAAQADLTLKQADVMKRQVEVQKIKAEIAETFATMENDELRVKLEAIDLALREESERLKDGRERMATLLGEGTKRMAQQQSNQVNPGGAQGQPWSSGAGM